MCPRAIYLLESVVYVCGLFDMFAVI